MATRHNCFDNEEAMWNLIKYYNIYLEQWERYTEELKCLEYKINAVYSLTPMSNGFENSKIERHVVKKEMLIKKIYNSEIRIFIVDYAKENLEHELDKQLIKLFIDENSIKSAFSFIYKSEKSKNFIYRKKNQIIKELVEIATSKFGEDILAKI